MEPRMIEIHSRRGPEDVLTVLSRKSLELNAALASGIRWKKSTIALVFVAVGLAIALAVVVTS